MCKNGGKTKKKKSSSSCSSMQAGDENRTRDNSLEGCGFTTKLHPQYCGGRTRTCDLRVMSPTRCQLLHSAIMERRIRDSNPCTLLHA